MSHKQQIFAVSGVKNSGKTTLIEKIVAVLSGHGMNVAVIKHDGHDFQPDVPDTDSYKIRSAGAAGVAVFSENRMMIIKEQKGISEQELMAAFPDADVIILEGFKFSEYPKVEVVRRNNSAGPVCDPVNLIAIYTDLQAAELPEEYGLAKVYGLEEAAELAEDLYRKFEGI